MWEGEIIFKVELTQHLLRYIHEADIHGVCTHTHYQLSFSWGEIQNN